MIKNHKTIHIALALTLLLTLAVNLNSVKNDSFFGDDYTYIVNNPAVKSIGNIPGFFTTPSMNSIVKANWVAYRPITMASYAVNYRLGGTDPFGYHLFNIIIHLLNVLLLYLLVSAITGRAWLAIASAALFGTHPFGSELVNYINTRSSSLSVFFYLLSFYLYVIRDRFASKKKGLACLAGSLVVFALALLSKEVPITLPLIIILHDLVYRREELKRSWVRRGIGLYSAYFLIALLFMLLRKTVFESAGIAGLANHPYGNIIMPAQIILYQTKLLFVPRGLTLFYFDFDPVNMLNLHTSIALAFLAAFIVLPLVIKRREVTFFTYWILITGIPSTVFDLSPTYSLILDHRLYILTIGSSVLAALIIVKVSGSLAGALRVRDPSKVSVAAVSVVVLLFSWSYVERNRVWRDGVSLGADMVEKYPESELAHYHLAQGYQRKGLLDPGLKEYEAALRLAPTHHQSRINMAGILVQKGRLERAAKEFQRVLEEDPTYHNAHFGLGYIYFQKGLYRDAIREFQGGLGYFPYSVDAYIYLGDAYGMLGFSGRARGEYLKGLELSPKDERILDRLADPGGY